MSSRRGIPTDGRGGSHRSSRPKSSTATLNFDKYRVNPFKLDDAIPQGNRESMNYTLPPAGVDRSDAGEPENQNPLTESDFKDPYKDPGVTLFNKDTKVREYHGFWVATELDRRDQAEALRKLKENIEENNVKMNDWGGRSHAHTLEIPEVTPSPNTEATTQWVRSFKEKKELRNTKLVSLGNGVDRYDTESLAVLPLITAPQMPVQRATWLIRVFTMSHLKKKSLAQNKARPRPEDILAHTTDWTHSVKETLESLITQIYANPNSEQKEQWTYQWTYLWRLVKWQLEEELIDEEQFFSWLLTQVAEASSTPSKLYHAYLPILEQLAGSILARGAKSRRLVEILTAALRQVCPTINSAADHSNHADLHARLATLVKFAILSSPDALVGLDCLPLPKCVHVGHSYEEFVDRGAEAVVDDRGLAVGIHRTPAVRSPTSVPLPSVQAEQDLIDRFGVLRNLAVSRLAVRHRMTTTLSEYRIGGDIKSFHRAFLFWKRADFRGAKTSLPSELQGDETSLSLLVMSICEWAVCPDGLLDVRRPMVSVVALREMMSCESLADIHDELFRFLDSYDPSKYVQAGLIEEDLLNQVCVLFAALARQGIFSYDNYLQTLVRKAYTGLMRNPKNLKPHLARHRFYAAMLPVTSPQFEGERRASLIFLPTVQNTDMEVTAKGIAERIALWLTDPGEFAEAVESSKISELLREVSSLTVYYKHKITEWLLRVVTNDENRPRPHKIPFVSRNLAKRINFCEGTVDLVISTLLVGGDRNGCVDFALALVRLFETDSAPWLRSYLGHIILPELERDFLIQNRVIDLLKSGWLPRGSSGFPEEKHWDPLLRYCFGLLLRSQNIPQVITWANQLPPRIRDFVAKRKVAATMELDVQKKSFADRIKDINLGIIQKDVPFQKEKEKIVRELVKQFREDASGKKGADLENLVAGVVDELAQYIINYRGATYLFRTLLSPLWTETSGGDFYLSLIVRSLRAIHWSYPQHPVSNVFVAELGDLVTAAVESVDANSATWPADVQRIAGPLADLLELLVLNQVVKLDALLYFAIYPHIKSAGLIEESNTSRPVNDKALYVYIHVVRAMLAPHLKYQASTANIIRGDGHPATCITSHILGLSVASLNEVLRLVMVIAGDTSGKYKPDTQELARTTLSDVCAHPRAPVRYSITEYAQRAQCRQDEALRGLLPSLSPAKDNDSSQSWGTVASLLKKCCSSRDDVVIDLQLASVVQSLVDAWDQTTTHPGNDLGRLAVCVLLSEPTRENWHFAAPNLGRVIRSFEHHVPHRVLDVIFSCFNRKEVSKPLSAELNAWQKDLVARLPDLDSSLSGTIPASSAEDDLKSSQILLTFALDLLRDNFSGVEIQQLGSILSENLVDLASALSSPKDAQLPAAQVGPILDSVHVRLDLLVGLLPHLRRSIGADVKELANKLGQHLVLLLACTPVSGNPILCERLIDLLHMLTAPFLLDRLVSSGLCTCGANPSANADVHRSSGVAAALAQNESTETLEDDYPLVRAEMNRLKVPRVLCRLQHLFARNGHCSAVSLAASFVKAEHDRVRAHRNTVEAAQASATTAGTPTATSGEQPHTPAETTPKKNDARALGFGKGRAAAKSSDGSAQVGSGADPSAHDLPDHPNPWSLLEDWACTPITQYYRTRTKPRNTRPPMRYLRTGPASERFEWTSQAVAGTLNRDSMPMQVDQVGGGYSQEGGTKRPRESLS